MENWAKEYKQIVFDKELLAKDSTAEWVTPGHPLFEAVRECALRKVQKDLRNGAIFFDLYSKEASRLDVYSAAVKDGRGNVIHKRIFVAQTDMSGAIVIRQPTIFLDLIPSMIEVSPPDGNGLPGRDQIEQSLFSMALLPFLQEINAQRTKEIETIEHHMEISLNELIVRQNVILSELIDKQQAGETAQPIAASMKSTEDRLDDLNERLERRRRELKQRAQSHYLGCSASWPCLGAALTRRENRLEWCKWSRMRE